MDTVRLFHRLLAYDARAELAEIVGYHLDGFDLTTLWEGQPMSPGLPPSVRLFVGPGELPDYVANPLSWPIGSARFVDILSRRAGADMQVLDAPLVDQLTGRPVVGYKIVNVARRLACLDRRRSEISYYRQQRRRIVAVPRIALKRGKVPASVHLFRIEEWPYEVIVSDELAQDCVGQGLRGVAFQQLGAPTGGRAAG